MKAKTTTFILTDLSKITLDREFEFRPLQPPHMCQWRGGIGGDSIYAEMVSSTMYSSSDYPLIDGFTNANSQPEEQQSQTDSILDCTITKMIDLTSLRSVIKTNEGHDHLLGTTFSSAFPLQYHVVFQEIKHSVTSSLLKCPVVHSSTPSTKAVLARSMKASVTTTLITRMATITKN